MKGILRKCLPLALALTLLCGGALAQTTFEGTVTAVSAREIYAANTAVVERLAVSVGQRVEAGDLLATLRTTKVYAEEEGKVAAVMGGVGELADALVARYGAVMMLTRPVTYVVTASVQTANNAVDTKLIRAGETVSLRSSASSSRTGEGVVTAVNGMDYTVEVTKGEFIVGEMVNLYRGDEYKDNQRIGRGIVQRNADAMVTAGGRIVSLAVQAGDTVHPGDLLMETLAGTGTSPEIVADEAGVIARLNVSQGMPIEENGVVAVLWPDDAMRVEITVNENDLGAIAVGDSVTLEFDWDVNGASRTTGVVESISAVPVEGGDAVAYTARIAFTPDASVRYGMSVTVSTLD